MSADSYAVCRHEQPLLVLCTGLEKFQVLVVELAAKRSCVGLELSILGATGKP